MSEQRNTYSKYVWVLLVVGALGRLPAMTFLSHVPIIVFSDFSYVETGRAILHLNFHALGDRVPVYPLLTAICGLNLQAIVLAQSLLGIAASLMIFDMTFRRTRHGLFSLLVGLACSLIPEVLIYESSLMTEALTSFLLVSTFWLITRCEDGENGSILLPLGLGSLAALAGLTRPLMLCLVPVYYCFLVRLWPPGKMSGREAIKRTIYYALPVVVLILGWCGFNYFNNGYFTPTVRAGQQLMDQVDPYVALAPDRFAVLRDAWIHSPWDGKGPPNKNFTLLYGSVLPELEKRTGKTEIQIAHDYQSLALYLQIHHPLLCLRRVEQGWMQFWGEPTVGEIDWPPGGGVGVDEFLMTMDDFLIRQVKAVFLVMALLSIPCALFRRKVFTKLEYLTFAVALWVSVFAALVEFGENRRFCVPFYMLIIYTVMTRGWAWIAERENAIVDSQNVAGELTHVDAS